MSAKRMTCSTCGKVKAAGAFRHGRNHCIPCRKVIYARWVAANPEKVAAIKRRYLEAHPKLAAEKARAFRKANPEKVKAYHRKYNETHREEIKESKHRWYLANREKVAEHDRLYAEANREKRLEYARQYREANREQIREKQRLSRANLKKLNGKKTAAGSTTGKITTKAVAARVRHPASPPPQPPSTPRRKAVLRGAGALLLAFAVTLGFSGARVFAADGPPKVAAKEVETIRKAAALGDATAQFNLGYCYFYGQGMPKDQAAAVKWLQKSAAQGYTFAQHVLGLSYANGDGVTKDNVMAYMWFDIAVRAGRDARKARDIVAAKMTPGQIAEARRMSHEWKPKMER